MDQQKSLVKHFGDSSKLVKTDFVFGGQYWQQPSTCKTYTFFLELFKDTHRGIVTVI